MALVMLPCDLPCWGAVQRHLQQLLLASDIEEMLTGMARIHDICNIGLDPEEECTPAELGGLRDFLNELGESERLHFRQHTLRSLVHRALHLQRWKPKMGLHFSLQQQGDVRELEYRFVSSLLAHAFFSTFPRRTSRTHPTLQDFNFAHFFKHLHRKSQHAKFRSFLHYFDWLEDNPGASEGTLKISRQVNTEGSMPDLLAQDKRNAGTHEDVKVLIVMTSREWLTLDDWCECALPLTRLSRRAGVAGRGEAGALRVVFASARLGGAVLGPAASQEALAMMALPELLSMLLSVEALEDNEVLRVEDVRMVAAVHRVGQEEVTHEEQFDCPDKVNVCCMDPDDYSAMPAAQWEEDNLLRELNKCLLAFQQRPLTSRPEKRLSPIGEACPSPTVTTSASVIIQQTSCSTASRSASPPTQSRGWLAAGGARRGRFIVLGSSGERLPVSRAPLHQSRHDSLYSSCDSSDDDEEERFHSAHESFDEESCTEAEARLGFASRLQAALQRAESADSSAYAVGYSVSGAGGTRHRIKRGGSGGFVLTEQASMPSADDSEYSFSTEYSSDLEEAYEQFSQWLEDDGQRPHEPDARDIAVIRFAGSLLKRTLSESFAGASVPTGDRTPPPPAPDGHTPNLALAARSLSLQLAKHHHRLAAQLNDKLHTTSDESYGDIVAQAKGEITQFLRWHPSVFPSRIVEKPEPVPMEAQKKRLKWTIESTDPKNQTVECEPVTIILPKVSEVVEGGARPKTVLTGNWGCGRRGGEPQLRAMLQWIAASAAGVPLLIHYSAGEPTLCKLDTVVRVLLDRKWSVGEATRALLRHARRRHTHSRLDLFDELLGL